MNSKSFIIGLIVGGVAASVSTLFTAPKSGVETRTDLKETTEAMKAQLEDVKIGLQDMKNSVATLSTDGRETIKSFVYDLKVAIEAWRTEIQPHQQQLQNELNKIEKSLEELENGLKTK